MHGRGGMDSQDVASSGWQIIDKKAPSREAQDVWWK